MKLNNININILKHINRETVIYIFFGVLTTILSIAVYSGIMYLTGADSGIMETYKRVSLANTVSTAVAVLFAFITNKVWVFRSISFDLKTVSGELIRFSTGRLFTYALETAALILLVDRLGLWQLGCKIFTTVLVILLNYIISKKAVFILIRKG